VEDAIAVAAVESLTVVVVAAEVAEAVAAVMD